MHVCVVCVCVCVCICVCVCVCLCVSLEDDGLLSFSSYQYDWKEEEARKNILRTHTTAVSARMLYKLGQQVWAIYLNPHSTCWQLRVCVCVCRRVIAVVCVLYYLEGIQASQVLFHR